VKKVNYLLYGSGSTHFQRLSQDNLGIFHQYNIEKLRQKINDTKNIIGFSVIFHCTELHLSKASGL
jgi:hypothetical protein